MAKVVRIAKALRKSLTDVSWYRQHKLFLTLLIAYLTLLLSFPMTMQGMESYAYAAAAEGYYDLSATFTVLSEKQNIPDFSQYHPNHPLPHLIAALLNRLTGIGALKIFQGMNFCGIIIFLIFHYLTALQLLQRPHGAVFATALAAVTYAVWASALSGEVQMLSLGFLMAAFYNLTRFFLAPPDTVNSRLVWAAFAYVTAVAFHQAAFFLGFPAGVAALVHSRSAHSLRTYLKVVLIIVVGWIFFYVFLVVILLKIRSFDQYLDTLFVYRQILQRDYGQIEWFMLLLGAALRSIAYSDFGLSYLAAILIICLILLGYGKMLTAKIPAPLKILLLGLPVAQIALQLAVRGRPEGINFWLFLIPCFSLSAAFLWKSGDKSPETPVVFGSLIILLALLNFYYFFLPNSRLKADEYRYSHLDRNYAQLPLALVIHEPVLTFVEGWSLGSQSGIRKQTWFFPCCGDHKYAKKLRQWMDRHEDFLLLSDNAGGAEHNLLSADNVQTEVLVNRRGQIAASLIPRSLYFYSSPGESYEKYLFLARVRRKGRNL